MLALFFFVFATCFDRGVIDLHSENGQQNTLLFCPCRKLSSLLTHRHASPLPPSSWLLTFSDPSGKLNFNGKAILHADGVDFSNGNSFKINMEELKLLEELGKGQYGTVQKVYHKPTNVTMAMKVCSAGLCSPVWPVWSQARPSPLTTDHVTDLQDSPFCHRFAVARCKRKRVGVCGIWYTEPEVDDGRL